MKTAKIYAFPHRMNPAQIIERRTISIATLDDFTDYLKSDQNACTRLNGARVTTPKNNAWWLLIERVAA